MGAEKGQSRLHNEQVDQKILFPSAAVSLTQNNLVVRGSTVSGTGAFTITLAPVAEMVGKIVSIYMVARNGTDDITISDKVNDASLSDIVLNAADEYTLLYCDGYNYYEIASNHT